jgi:hypothetical protein
MATFRNINRGSFETQKQRIKETNRGIKETNK